MRYDAAIIGAGIVGLSTAYSLSEMLPRKRLVVVEKEPEIAAHQTGRNSGVIHSGIYYAPGSLKAVNCRQGRKLLIEFCQREDIRYEICGKVIVAVNGQEIPTLRRIQAMGGRNGVICERLSREELLEREPHCAGIEALLVPEAGIVDYRSVAERLASIIVARGSELRLSSMVVGIETKKGSVIIRTATDEVEADIVVNCAGLHSDQIALRSGTDPGVRIVPFRGEYFELRQTARHFCRHLIYPVPDTAFPFLGVHFTRMIDGRVECGPNAVLALAREGYHVYTLNAREAMQTLFYGGFRRLARAHWREGLTEFARSCSKRLYLQSLRRLVPGLSAADISATRSGVRAQAVRRDGSLVDDFLILESRRFVNVCNVPSPAATASLNIGRQIALKVAGRFTSN